MNILYVAPENVTGGFSLFVEGHRRRGNQARYITFFQSRFGYPEDLVFNLWGTPGSNWVVGLKKWMNLGDRIPVQFTGELPIRQPRGLAERFLFPIRDFINSPRIQRAIESNGLNDFDLYHFEQGIDPFRDGRWASDLSRRGKGIVCFYHGSDLRRRGLIEPVHRASRLNLTCEIDLLNRLPGMKYLYLPIDTDRLQPTSRPPDDRIRISHAARNRSLKGSDTIERIVRKLAERYPIDWVMIENRTHTEALALKAASDIYIDQITDLGGWGYGVSSVESLAMGIPTISRINPKVAAFLGIHPFISADEETLENAIIRLIENPLERVEVGRIGREWVKERHGLDSVMEVLYGYYREEGLI